VGAKGTVFNSWNYDVSMQTGRVELKRVYQNDFSNTRIGRALNVVTDANGNAVCQSVVDGTDPNCVPYNFYSLGGVTQQALDYLQVPGLANGSTQQEVTTFTLSSDLGDYGIKIPVAQSGISVLFGGEHRREKLALTTDNAFSTGDLAGQGGATIGRRGQVSVREAFAEMRIPIAEKLPFADRVQASASYRYSDYNTGKTANTGGIGLEYAPVAGYLLRGSYQRAIRAANLEELFLAQGTNLFDIAAGDPCGPSLQATLVQCQRSGITAATYGAAILDSPAGQYNFLQGGNPNLNPEKANTVTLGLAVQPTRGLSASVDFWRIKLTEYILAPPALTVLNQCVFENRFCDQVQRDRLGTLWALPTGRIVALNANLGGVVTSGWDIAASYTQSLGGLGRMGMTFLGTRTSKWEFEPIKGLGKFDCAGLVGAQCATAPMPKWRHKLRGNWGTPWDLDVALTWRHISKVKNETTSDNPILAGPTAGVDSELGSRNYLDLAGSWRIDKTFSLTAGINNLTDKDPPIVSQTLAGPSIFGNGNTFPGVYDTLGRFVFLNLQAKF
jgi:outer membrane receptor protein involved in Fe transport